MKDSIADGILNGGATTPFWYQGPGTILSSPWSPVTSTVPIYNTQTAYRLAVSRAGSLPYDQIDSLVLNQVKTLGNAPTGTTAGTAGPDGTLYTSQAQTGLGNNGYGAIVGGTAALDADQDGMPDYWEKSMGSNPNSNDAMTIGAGGYTLLEQYINWLGNLHALAGKDSAINIDSSARPAASPPHRLRFSAVGSASTEPAVHAGRWPHGPFHACPGLLRVGWFFIYGHWYRWKRLHRHGERTGICRRQPQRAGCYYRAFLRGIDRDIL